MKNPYPMWQENKPRGVIDLVEPNGDVEFQIRLGANHDRSANTAWRKVAKGWARMTTDWHDVEQLKKMVELARSTGRKNLGHD